MVFYSASDTPSDTPSGMRSITQSAKELVVGALATCGG
jgi:hypothetical protein